MGRNEQRHNHDIKCFRAQQDIWKPISANVLKKKKDPLSPYNEKPSQNSDLVSQNNEKLTSHYFEISHYFKKVSHYFEILNPYYNDLEDLFPPSHWWKQAST